MSTESETTMSQAFDFDTIVIGSGAGGLTAALCLARGGQKVLVLEQHYLPGGWCHSFSLDGFQFSPGVHYIGQLQEGGMMRKLYEGLGVADDLVFLELNPDGFDRVRIGDQRFDYPAGFERFQDRLCERFPLESQGIQGFLNTTRKLGAEIEEEIQMRSVLDFLALPWKIPTVLRFGFRSLNSVMNHFGLKDPVLRTVLASQSGDHGLGPKQAPFAMHAGVMNHYFEGGWYPKGGAKSLPKALIQQFRKLGGEIRVKTPVAKILVEGHGSGRKAIGVRLQDGTELRARQILSNADPEMTFRRLVGEEHLSGRLRRRLRKTRYSLTAVSLFLAVDMDLKKAGLDSGNLWYHAGPDIQSEYAYGEMGSPLDQPVPGLFLTATTLKDPSKRKDGLHTLEAFTWTSWDAFKAWQGTEHGRRPPEYQAFKDALSSRILERLDQLVPGLASNVVFQALGTPLTNQHYVAAHRGNLYGIEKSRFQMGPFAYDVKTEIPGLFLCGASTLGHGVAGASISGVAAACRILRCRHRDLLTGSGTLTTLPADHPELWPSAYQPEQNSKRPSPIGAVK
ncbi:MAG: NAD(P)/FAD-dependent oxidoreductase [Planctomycetota bacterium]|nr:MAG: NAD(P)/FAD-dependent oxidoreductase [Planctomycetota bacterium]